MKREIEGLSHVPCHMSHEIEARQLNWRAQFSSNSSRTKATCSF